MVKTLLCKSNNAGSIPAFVRNYLCLEYLQVLYSWLVRPSDTRNVDGSNPSTCTTDCIILTQCGFSFLFVLGYDLGYVLKLPRPFKYRGVEQSGSLSVSLSEDRRFKSFLRHQQLPLLFTKTRAVNKEPYH